MHGCPWSRAARTSPTRVRGPVHPTGVSTAATGRPARPSTPSRARWTGSSPSATASTPPIAVASIAPRSIIHSGRCRRPKPRSRRTRCPRRTCRSARPARAASRDGRTCSSGRCDPSRRSKREKRDASSVSPQRRTALVSVVAACVLIAVKLIVGIATHSLGLISEALHSGTDLVAALLTYFAVGVAARPADPGHAYGHGKADHLAALAEAAFLVVASLFISWRAILRLAGSTSAHVHATGWALLVLGFVIVL